MRLAVEVNIKFLVMEKAMKTIYKNLVHIFAIIITIVTFCGCGEDDRTITYPENNDLEESCNISFDQVPDYLPGAGWNLLGEINASGAGDSVLTKIPVGNYISFWDTVFGYMTPPSDTMNLSPGDSYVIPGIYEKEVIFKNSVKINELFFSGSDPSTFYFYGQYCELYNASSDTLYLDGMILTKQRPAEADVEDPPLEYVRATYAYQFPGIPVTGREYPIAPGEIIVIASDAMDHTMWSENSVDLSNAHWETYNPHKADYDNLNVPNLLSINPDVGPDWMLNLSHDAVVLATGEHWSLEEYENSSGNISEQIIIPLDEVIDGVEFSSSLDIKYLTVRVDEGFAGVGISKYSGMSIERRELGLDSDNSSYDFINNVRPTPGFFHIK